MIDFGPGAALLQLIEGEGWLIVIGAVLAAALIPKTKKGKALALVSVIALLMLFPVRQVFEQRQQQSAAQSRLAEAEARFRERCKTAGEFIHKTVENVDGILLMKLRPSEMNSEDQYGMNDPYGHDSTGDEYINSFLFGKNQNGFLTRGTEAVRLGYSYVEAVNPQDGQRYRYTGRIDQPSLRDKKYADWVREFVLDKTPAPGPALRYGVTYDDISTREDRDYWIAGSSLKVIDLSTNEVMAERIGYMMDRGQGNSSGGRSPWLLAANNACPTFPIDGSRHTDQVNQTRNFVEKILHIKQEK